MDTFKKYGKPILGFAISTAVVFGSMNIWILTILSPLFVFLVFKLLKIWKSKERVVYGVPAIVIGVILFFLVFSYSFSDVPHGNFENGNLSAVIKPFSTSNMNANFNITVTYKGIVHQNLSYVVTNFETHEVVKSSEVSGAIKGNLTVYNFQLILGRGIYNITMHVNKTSLSISAIKEEPLTLFEKYIISAGWYVALLLSSLYLLFIFGVHMIRKGQKMGMRHGYKK